MRQSIIRRFAWTVLALGLGLATFACGGGRHTAPTAGLAGFDSAAAPAGEAIAQITAAPAPPGVDPAFWSKLTAELARQVAFRAR